MSLRRTVSRLTSSGEALRARASSRSTQRRGNAENSSIRAPVTGSAQRGELREIARDQDLERFSGDGGTSME